MKKFWKAVILTSLFVAVTDLVLAYSMQYAKTGEFADKMLLYMAGGALGLDTSMQGGFWVQLLGLIFHFFIAFSFTLLVFIVFQRLKLQTLNVFWILLLGMLYSPFVQCFMQFIVLPLTRLPAPSPITLESAKVGWTIFGVVFGIPIFLSASKYYSEKKRS